MIKQCLKDLWSWFTGKADDEQMKEIKYTIRRYPWGNGTVNPEEENDRAVRKRSR